MGWTALISILLIMSLDARAIASVKVAFFEHRTKDGQLQPIEEGGHLYHVAIQNGEVWMNAKPYYGVHEVSDVRVVGDLYSVIEIPFTPAMEDFERQRGKTFNMHTDWRDVHTTYCSKLVAQILNIRPIPLKKGIGLGLSPDDLYLILKSGPHREVLSCRKSFL